MGHAKLTDIDHLAEWPEFLVKAKQKTADTTTTDRPIMVRMDVANAEKQLRDLIAKVEVAELVDNYDEQFAELQLSLNAHLYRANVTVQKNSIKDALLQHYGDKHSWQLGAWVYFPWNRKLVHILDEKAFLQLRSIRNRDLITAPQQDTLADFKVACVGMSVGSASALALTITGISQKIKLADGAVISGSNLNRILTGVESVGLEKSLVIARKLYEMNPYIEVVRHGKVAKDNISNLFDEPWPIQAVIDEIDDLESKIRLRIEARKRKLPVVMATELADSVMLDVERFDLEPERPLFHGMIPGIDKILDNPDMNHRVWMKHAVSIIGPENMPTSMQRSLLKIGSSIVTHPQLGSTVMVTGGVTTFAIKQIALGKSMPSGRTNIALGKLLVPLYNTRAHRKRHKQHTKIIKKAIDSM